MFGIWRRIWRGRRAADAPAAEVGPEPGLKPAGPQPGEASWLIRPTFEGRPGDLHPGFVGVPWRGVIEEFDGRIYQVRPEGGSTTSTDYARVRREDLHPTAEAARDAYIAAVEADLKIGTPAELEDPGPAGGEAGPPDPGRPDVGRAGPPAVGDRYWLIAPVHDALNLGFGTWEPWRGVVVEIRGGTYRVAPEEDIGPGPFDPGGRRLIWRDADVDAPGLHETEADAWAAYRIARAGERAEADRHRTRWVDELARWTRARDAGLARPPEADRSPVPGADGDGP